MTNHLEGSAVSGRVNPGLRQRDRTVRWWDAATGRLRSTFLGHTREVTSVAFSPDGRILASGGFDTTVKLWDLERQHEPRTFHTPAGVVLGLCFSRDGQELVIACADGTLRRRRLPDYTVLQDKGDEVWAAAFAPDGNLLAIGTDNGKGKDSIQRRFPQGGNRLTFLAYGRPSLTPTGRRTQQSNLSAREWANCSGPEPLREGLDCDCAGQT